MKERPILFNGPMVRALLDGSKTQTRRVVKSADRWPACAVRAAILSTRGTAMAIDTKRQSYGPEIKCPYSMPSDQLWVREAHYLTDNGHAEFAVYAADDDAVREHLQRMDGLHADFPLAVKAAHQKLRPSIHMPRWASRITLEVVSVRVERLQDISEADAEAEGIGFLREVPDVDETLTAKQFYECLWESINGPGSWDANPWVWAVKFKRLPA